MPDLLTLLIVCPLVFLGGFVDAIAGGGGIITLPAYLMAGLPPHIALATNKLSSAVGTCVSTARLARGGYIDARLALPVVACALLGSPVGARLALLVPETAFRFVLMLALPIVAVFVLRRKSLRSETTPMARGRRTLLMGACALACGIYDGFYGPGTGTFLLLLFSGVAQLGVRDASGQTKAANLASNIAALVTFALAGQVWWALGLIAGVFGIAGHYLGAGRVLKDGTRIVRPIIAVVLVLLFAKTALELAGIL
ncbi:MAG: TSUP family transporter [Coriobacteriia bacterium]|nr:TSUP family transporter [Coriobacteriia bacterium]MBS5477546.1 TSUP family transporter [Coriobacteriia bacterium]